MCEHGLEGVVAKRLRGIYRPGQRGSWLTVKNPDYWRREDEVAALTRSIERWAVSRRSVAASSAARDARLSSRAIAR